MYDLEKERCIVFALENNYQILYTKDKRVDFIFIKAERILICGENGQLMVNFLLRKAANFNQTGQRPTKIDLQKRRKTCRLSQVEQG